MKVLVLGSIFQFQNLEQTTVVILKIFPDANTLSGEENGNPLQCSCLEKPRDGEAWWAAISGVAQSQTQLKRLSSSSNTLSITDSMKMSFGKLRELVMDREV